MMLATPAARAQRIDIWPIGPAPMMSTLSPSVIVGRARAVEGDLGQREPDGLLEGKLVGNGIDNRPPSMHRMRAMAVAR